MADPIKYNEWKLSLIILRAQTGGTPTEQEERWTGAMTT